MALNFLLSIIQLLIILILAPLINGIIKKIKAWFQCRKGPNVIQPYYDLIKLLRKDCVISEHASWVFRLTPYIAFIVTLSVSILVPVIVTDVPMGFAGDAIAVVYLFALVRFFTALSALDTGSAFCGMGSSREMSISSIAEPAMMLSLFTVALAVGSTNLGTMAGAVAQSNSIVVPSHILAFAALVIVAITETGRMPVDNPATHLELTMIHEGLILEYSGKYLGLMNWTHAVKQLLILTILANVFIPWGISTDISFMNILVSIPLYFVKVILLAVMVALIECAYAKLRLFRVPDLLALSHVFSILALIVYFVIRGQI